MGKEQGCEMSGNVRWSSSRRRQVTSGRQGEVWSEKISELAQMRQMWNEGTLRATDKGKCDLKE